ncbi:MAG: valine--tRNA ligase [archaeon]
MGELNEYNPKEIEKKWSDYWEREGIFAFDEKSAKPKYIIDSPPPTISGFIHTGHAFSYSQAEFIARYKRMKGFSVYYPFGFDDNGLPTERYVEKKRGIKANRVPRKEFARMCMEETVEAERQYREVWTRLGVSCDWGRLYRTVSPEVQRISQHSFLELWKMGREYRAESPSIYCPECQTAIAQVELEDKEVESAFNDIEFGLENGKSIIIATTRPELLSSCVAVFINPEDKRAKELAGKKAEVPLFGYWVPIIADQKANMEKGTGIVMCCTFGDQTDIEWWKTHKLPLRVSFNRNGTMAEIAGKFAGMKIKEARKAIIEELKVQGKLKGQKKIMHALNVHERCGTEIEFLLTKQWFIKYLDLKEKFLEAGRKINWHPDYMRHRYENWVRGLQWDWCISRQRYFGVPFPVWYCKKCDEPVFAEERQLPVDPTQDKPPVKECAKCHCTEFEAETDVLDTWATSSLTPLIIAGWPEKGYEKLFPSSLRPNAHDIITFWDFNTIVKSLLHEGAIPWQDVMISGHGLDESGKPMHKSKGNTIDPIEIMEKYSADALRYWASGVNLGNDAPLKEKELVAGKKLATKLWNASKFVLLHLKDYDGEKPERLEAMDAFMLNELNKLVTEATNDFDDYDYAKAKSATELFFWHSFCDYYLEMAKDRLYNPGQRGREARVSCQYALRELLLAMLKLLAPIMPFVTEEIYCAGFGEKGGKKSLHLEEWPKAAKEWEFPELEEGGEMAIEIIAEARQFKSANHKSMKEAVEIRLEAELEGKLKGFIEDIAATTGAKRIIFGEKREIGFPAGEAIA